MLKHDINKVIAIVAKVSDVASDLVFCIELFTLNEKILFNSGHDHHIPTFFRSSDKN